MDEQKMKSDIFDGILQAIYDLRVQGEDSMDLFEVVRIDNNIKVLKSALKLLGYKAPIADAQVELNLFERGVLHDRQD